MYWIWIYNIWAFGLYFPAVLCIISIATGGKEVAYDEQKIEGKDKDQEEEKLKTLICKMIPKYKIISKKKSMTVYWYKKQVHHWRENICISNKFSNR